MSIIVKGTVLANKRLEVEFLSNVSIFSNFLNIDFVKGYVCLPRLKYEPKFIDKHCHQPTAETIVICATIPGHAGGPCIDREGNLIGMLTRKKSNNEHRCYLVPSCELKTLLRKAKYRSRR